MCQLESRKPLALVSARQPLLVQVSTSWQRDKKRWKGGREGNSSEEKLRSLGVFEKETIFYSLVMAYLLTKRKNKETFGTFLYLTWDKTKKKSGSASAITENSLNKANNVRQSHCELGNDWLNDLVSAVTGCYGMKKNVPCTQEIRVLDASWRERRVALPWETRRKLTSNP